MGMEFFESKKIKARRKHICSLCGREISPGETYEYQTGKYDGDFFSNHFHAECSDVVSEYVYDRADGEEWDTYSVEEWWRNHRCDFCIHSEYGKNDCGRKLDRTCWCTKYVKNEEEK